MDSSFVAPEGHPLPDLPCKNGLFERTDGPVDIRRLDISVTLTQEARADLPPVSEQTHEQMADAGWPERVLADIGSEAEANIYKNANLEPEEINGKPALVRSDIDLDQKDVFGKSNLERMQAGLAPLDANKQPIELHHIGQKQESCLAELTFSEHRGTGNDNILHNKRQESAIDRPGFARERAEHWMARAADFEARG